ncbi:MAG: DMT family transporter [Acidobacteria bacterium]|nr:DMT family transporter [Acidobacteriota bacterium]
MTNFVSPGLSLAAALSWGAADFSGGLAAKRVNTFAVVVVAHGTGLLFMLALALLAHEPLPNRVSLLWGIAAGLVGGVGLAAFYKALAIGKMGVNAPLSAVVTALLPLLFSFSTEGLPRPWQLIGFALALTSVWLIAATPALGRPAKGLGLAVLAGIGFSGFLLFSKLAGAAAVFWPLVSARAASFLLMLTIVLSSKRDWKPISGCLWYMLVAGILDSAANALYIVATQHGRLDVAAILASLYPASTVLLARALLNERLSRMQSIGIVAALFAIAIITAK